MDHVNNNDGDDYDSNADNEYAVLEPVLTFAKSATAPIPAELHTLVDNPSALHISDAISDVLPLNNKQKRTECCHDILSRSAAPRESSRGRRGSVLSAYGRPGGTGKSRIIDAARLGMKLLGRERELLVIAPTGHAANNVQGTIHTGLDIAVRNHHRQITPKIDKSRKSHKKVNKHDIQFVIAGLGL